MDYVKDIIPEGSEQRLSESRKKTWGKSWERPERNVVFGHGMSRKCAGETAGAYAASFVTRECLASLVCDPTILISCQS